MACYQGNTILQYLDYSYTYKCENGKNIQYSVHTVSGTHRYTGKHWVVSVKKVYKSRANVFLISEANWVMSPDKHHHA